MAEGEPGCTATEEQVVSAVRVATEGETGYTGTATEEDVIAKMRFVATEAPALFLMTLVFYSVKKDAYKDLINLLQSRPVEGFEEQFLELTAVDNLREGASWGWPLRIRTKDETPTYEEKPKNITKRFALRKNRQGQWTYIVNKALKYFILLGVLHAVGLESTLPFLDKLKLLVRRSESTEAANTARVLRGVFCPDIACIIYAMSQTGERDDLVEENGRPIGTASEELLPASNPSSRLQVDAGADADAGLSQDAEMSTGGLASGANVLVPLDNSTSVVADEISDVTNSTATNSSPRRLTMNVGTSTIPEAMDEDQV